MAKRITAEYLQTGTELLEDSDLPIEDIDTDEEETESKTREKWAGGFTEIYDTADLANQHPVTKEDGTPPDEKDAKTFKVFEVEFYQAVMVDRNEETKTPIKVFVWARNTNEAIVKVASTYFAFHASQFGAARGRRKKFVVEPAKVMIVNHMISIGDKQALANVFSLLPDYLYLTQTKEDGTPADPPEYCVKAKK